MGKSAKNSKLTSFEAATLWNIFECSKDPCGENDGISVHFGQSISEVMNFLTGKLDIRLPSGVLSSSKAAAEGLLKMRDDGLIDLVVAGRKKQTLRVVATKTGEEVFHSEHKTFDRTKRQPPTHRDEQEAIARIRQKYIERTIFTTKEIETALGMAEKSGEITRSRVMEALQAIDETEKAAADNQRPR